MKKLALFLISLYQILVSPFLHLMVGTSRICRYQVSCSEFAKQNILKYGIIVGTRHAVRRFLSCRPGAKPYGSIL